MTLDLEIHSEDPAAQLSFEQLLYLLNKRLAAGNIQDAGVGTTLITDLSVTTAKVTDQGIVTGKINSQAITTAKRQLQNQLTATANLPLNGTIAIGVFHNLGIIPNVAADLIYTGAGSAVLMYPFPGGVGASEARFNFWDRQGIGPVDVTLRVNFW